MAALHSLWGTGPSLLNAAHRARIRLSGALRAISFFVGTHIATVFYP
jgi:hypothetical protein